MGAVLPPTKQVDVVNGHCRGQVTAYFGCSGTSGLFSPLAFRRSEAVGLGTVLCAVLVSICMMLVVLLFV